MTAVIQRVSSASVAVNGEVAGSCSLGFLILLGIFKGDRERDAAALAEKISKLRVFEDAGGKMNLSLSDVSGSVLIISQFTLCADYSHGNRPDFLSAAPPDAAKQLYELFCGEMKKRVGCDNVQNGIFGADMKVSLVNDGPVTIIMESGVLLK